MSDKDVFDPDVIISEQALARKRKFLETKRQGNFEVVPTPVKDLLPQLWFDDSGEIVSVTYDADFTPDVTWKTCDFDEMIVKNIIAKGTNYYKVDREVDGDDVKYSVVAKKDQTSRVVHSSDLRHASEKYDSEKVSILIDVKKDSITLTLTDVGRDAMKALGLHQGRLIRNKDMGPQNFYITEPLNPHFMFEQFSFDTATLLDQDVKINLTEDYRLKSVYFDGPFVYGRL